MADSTEQDLEKLLLDELAPPSATQPTPQSTATPAPVHHPQPVVVADVNKPLCSVWRQSDAIAAGLLHGHKGEAVRRLLFQYDLLQNQIGEHDVAHPKNILVDPAMTAPWQEQIKAGTVPPSIPFSSPPEGNDYIYSNYLRQVNGVYSFEWDIQDVLKSTEPCLTASVPRDYFESQFIDCTEPEHAGKHHVFVLSIEFVKFSPGFMPDLLLSCEMTTNESSKLDWTLPHEVQKKNSRPKNWFDSKSCRVFHKPAHGDVMCSGPHSLVLDCTDADSESKHYQTHTQSRVEIPSMVAIRPRDPRLEPLYMWHPSHGLRDLEWMRWVASNFSGVTLIPAESHSRQITDMVFVEQPNYHTNVSPNPVSWYIATHGDKVFGSWDELKRRLWEMETDPGMNGHSFVKQTPFAARPSGKANHYFGLSRDELSKLVGDLRQEHSANHNCMFSDNDPEARVRFTFKAINTQEFWNRIKHLARLQEDGRLSRDKPLHLSLELRFTVVAI